MKTSPVWRLLCAGRGGRGERRSHLQPQIVGARILGVAPLVTLADCFGRFMCCCDSSITIGESVEDYSCFADQRPSSIVVLCCAFANIARRLTRPAQAACLLSFETALLSQTNNAMVLTAALVIFVSVAAAQPQIVDESAPFAGQARQPVHLPKSAQFGQRRLQNQAIHIKTLGEADGYAVANAEQPPSTFFQPSPAESTEHFGGLPPYPASNPQYALSALARVQEHTSIEDKRRLSSIIQLILSIKQFS